MSDDRLFPLDGIPEVPLFREPPPGRGALVMDERISHDYPPEWHRHSTCDGTGVLIAPTDLVIEVLRCGSEIDVRITHIPSGNQSIAKGRSELRAKDVALRSLRGGLRRDERWRCAGCLGMGSLKAMVRLLADHRCERCHHPCVPKGDAKMLGVEPAPYRWSPCDERCTHLGQVRMRETYRPGDYEWSEYNLSERGGSPSDFIIDHGPGGEPIRRWEVEAEWRVLTVHHLDGDKANLSWWNLAALCQRCHLEIQAKVVLERVYPYEHSEWFKPHAAGWYAYAYLGEDLTRTEVAARMDELLALESVPA